MGAKSLRIRLKNDRVEKVEDLMVRMERAINSNVCQLGKNLRDIQGELDLIYEELKAHTIRGLWLRFKMWLDGKQ
jgi:hypothetical protein